MSGVINGTAPNPVRLAEMCDHLGNVMSRPSWLPVPDFALKAVLGEGASVVGVSFFFLLLCVFCNHIHPILVYQISGSGGAKGASCKSQGVRFHI